jgi:hypothetical protein
MNQDLVVTNCVPAHVGDETEQLVVENCVPAYVA